MDVVYTKHLKFRLKMRSIPSYLPKKIFEESKEHYYDKLTEHYVAVQKLTVNNQLREFGVTYDKKGGIVEIITIHPLKIYQKIIRINSGRWREI